MSDKSLSVITPYGVMSKPRLLPEIVKRIVLNAPIEAVWKTVSTSEGLETWWMASTLEARKGNKFILHAGQFGDSKCKVTEVEPPHLLSFTWDQDWQLTFKLRELKPGETEFTLIHSGWPDGKVNRFGQPYEAVRKVMDDGWERIVKEKLKSRFSD